LLKFGTYTQLIQKRKEQKIQMMINENIRNKITFSDEEEQKAESLDDEEQ